MSLRARLLQRMEEAWRDVLHQFRDLDYSLDWKEDPEDPSLWSARDVLAHLLASLETVREALSSRTPGDPLPVPPETPARSPEVRALSLRDLLERLEGLYREVRAWVETVPEEALAETVPLQASPSQEPLSLAEALERLLPLHWEEHARQVLALREQLGVADL